MISKWLINQRKKNSLIVKKKDLYKLSNWIFNKKEIYHNSKKFFNFQYIFSLYPVNLAV